MTLMNTITTTTRTLETTVGLDQIIESVDFRFRDGGIDAIHKADLASTIRNTCAGLDPVLLWQPQAGENGAECGLVLLDGAHRLAAYRAAQWSQPIPAIVLLGADRRAALGAALKANSKRQLGMSQAERMDAAWRLVREPVTPRFKVREIAFLADVAGSTVDNMRARFRLMHEEGIEITGSWARDRRTRDYGEEGAFGQMPDARRNAEISKLAVDIRDLIDRRKHPERAILRDSYAVWEAVGEAFGENAMKHMLEYLLGGEDEADEWLEAAKSGRDEVEDCDGGDDPQPQF